MIALQSDQVRCRQLILLSIWILCISHFTTFTFTCRRLKTRKRTSKSGWSRTETNYEPASVCAISIVV